MSKLPFYFSKILQVCKGMLCMRRLREVGGRERFRQRWRAGCGGAQAVTVDRVVLRWQDTGSDCSPSSPSTPSTMWRSVPRWLPSSHLQPGPFLPGGPQSRQKHTQKNNMQGPQRQLRRRRVANTKPGGRKSPAAPLLTRFLTLLTVSASRWMRPFDVKAGQSHCGQ